MSVALPVAAPRRRDVPRWHSFSSAAGDHVLLCDSGAVFDVDPETAAGLRRHDPIATRALAPGLALQPDRSIVEPAPQNVSLNLTSRCNLGCDYCYAGRGSFEGKQLGAMSWPVARAAIDGLLGRSDRRHPVTVGFLGGEPLLAGELLVRAVRYASVRGRALGQEVRFSLTTNGELLSDGLRAVLRAHPFAVTISVDGGRALHEQQRRGARFQRLAAGVGPLLAEPGLARVSARATIIRGTLDLTDRFDALRALGFSEIGFSPVRVGPAEHCLRGADWDALLREMIRLGERELERLGATGRSAFANLETALGKIHAGSASPFPCGAGGGYFSVATDGRWYACHRAIGDEDYALGDNTGLDRARRRAFLEARHVDQQTDCSSCWARYLCSGSCHQEARARSAASCGFIRGWLEFCLAAYCTLSRQRPAYFEGSLP